MSSFFDKRLFVLKEYIPGEQPDDFDSYIKLNTNESPFPPSPLAVERLNAESISKLNLYPDPSCKSLAKILAEYYNVENGNVFISNGSDETLAFCFHGFCPNGAVFPDITYGFYDVYCSMFLREKEIIPLDKEFRINIQDYCDTSKTVFIANPNAPTGICLDLDKVEELVNQKNDRLVIVDEAYIDFGGESAVGLTKKYENLLVVGTFSKSRSLAGGRVGFAVGNDALIRDLEKMKYSFNPYSLNRISLIAAQAAVEDIGYFDKCRKEIIFTREKTSSTMKSLGFDVPESKTNFIFAGRNKKISAENYYKKLKENKVLIRYFNSERIEDFVRITIGTAEQMDSFIEVTNKILEE